MASGLAGRSVLLAGLFSAKVGDPEAELAAHARRIVAQGGRVVAQVIQRRGVSRARSPGGSRRMNAPMDPGTYFGAGKVTEMAEQRRTAGADLVVVAGELSPSQRANLERIIGCPVLDLSALA